MVRTRADAGATKVSAAKAPRKVLGGGGGGGAGPSSSGSKTPGKERYSGGNSYNPQPTPEWQKGIGNFFKGIPKPQNTEETSTGSAAGGSSSSSSSSEFKKNGIIDDEDD